MSTPFAGSPLPTSMEGERLPIVGVVGPTASGKTQLSLALAERLGGEIVNTDAMAVYRGMDIGTAKASAAERDRVPHHLLDLLEVTEPLTVAEFQGWARATIAELRARGVIPILVGGSALYTRAILDRFDFPGTDPDVRAALEAEAVDLGSAPMYDRLTRLDPAAAAAIRPDNTRRIVRALEVIELTGRPFSATLPDLTYVDPATRQLGVSIARPQLHERIELRVRRMFDDGLVAEVADLMERGLTEGRTAREAIGYRQVIAHLAGDITLEDAVEQTIVATRRFARRQDSWWRKDPRITWLDYDDPELVEHAVAAVAQPSGTSS